MTPYRLSYSWYVLHTKSRFENVVYEGLNKKSLVTFLPKVTVKSRRRDRNQMIKVPLFPGYLFVKSNLDPNEHLEILKTTGAVRLLGTQGGPVPVADDTVDSLKIMIAADQPVSTGNTFKKGDKVMVVYGPFAGVKGVFIRYRGKGRVMVNVDALGQSAQVDVNEEDLEILPDILS